MEATLPTPPGTAGVIRRIISLIYDLLLLLGISFGYGVATVIIRLLLGADTMQPPEGLAAVLTLAGAGLCYATFFGWCWIKRGQTLGMKTWRMRLQMIDGSPITLRTCALRCLLAPLCVLAGGIGFWWCWFDGKGNSLQDRLTGMETIVLPKTP